jgi:hypothetical protein
MPQPRRLPAWAPAARPAGNTRTGPAAPGRACPAAASLVTSITQASDSESGPSVPTESRVRLASHGARPQCQ